MIGNPNFGPYFVGNAASASGTWFQNLAASVLVYRATHSPLMLGVLNFCNFVPVLLLVAVAGSVADRFDRRRILIATQLLAMAVSGTLAALAFEGLARVWVVIVLALGLGVASAFSSPASQALVGELVSPSELGSAVALNSVTYNLGRVVGPTLAAVSIVAFGIPTTFAINVALPLLLILGLFAVHPAARRHVQRSEARLRESIDLLRTHPGLLAFLLIVSAVGFASDPINTEAPAFAHAFGQPTTHAGYIVGTFGAGAVIAAFLLAGRVVGSRRRMIATLGTMGICVAGFSVSPSLWIGFPLLVASGFGYLASNTSATTQLQLDVEPHQRGRVMALWSVAFIGLRPFASLADGAIAGAVGVRIAGVCLALPVLLIAIAIYFLRGHHNVLTIGEAP